MTDHNLAPADQGPNSLPSGGALTSGKPWRRLAQRSGVAAVFSAVLLAAGTMEASPALAGLGGVLLIVAVSLTALAEHTARLLDQPVTPLTVPDADDAGVTFRECGA